jgi:hypothetical protein
MMAIAFFKKAYHPDAKVIYEGIPLYSVHAKFNELVDPVIKEHGFEPVVE